MNQRNFALIIAFLISSAPIAAVNETKTTQPKSISTAELTQCLSKANEAHTLSVVGGVLVAQSALSLFKYCAFHLINSTLKATQYHALIPNAFLTVSCGVPVLAGSILIWQANKKIQEQESLAVAN